MKQILNRLTEEFPFVGTRAATEADFYAYCERRGVHVSHTFAFRDGLYVHFPFDGSDHIFLNPSLTGFAELYVMFHELGHQMFHVPSRSVGIEHFDRSLCRRNHDEAETVAAMLLITPDELTRAIGEGVHLWPCRVGSLFRRRYRIEYEHND